MTRESFGVTAGVGEMTMTHGAYLVTVRVELMKGPPDPTPPRKEGWGG